MISLVKKKNTEESFSHISFSQYDKNYLNFRKKIYGLQNVGREVQFYIFFLQKGTIFHSFQMFYRFRHFLKVHADKKKINLR